MKTGNSKITLFASAALSVLLILGGLITGTLLSRPGTPAGAQSDTGNNSTARPQQITVVGMGTTSAKPDLLKITIGAAVQKESVKAAQVEVDRIVAAMQEKIKDAGIADKDYATSQYTVEAVQDYSNPKQPTGITIGYRVVSMYEITFRDPTKAPALIDALTSAGANTIYGTYYTVSNPDALGKQAYDGAMKDAQERAEKLASLSNMTLGKILSVSEVTNTPYPMAFRGEGAGGASFSPGQQTITTSVVVTYEASPAK